CTFRNAWHSSKKWVAYSLPSLYGFLCEIIYAAFIVYLWSTIGTSDVVRALLLLKLVEDFFPGVEDNIYNFTKEGFNCIMVYCLQPWVYSISLYTNSRSHSQRSTTAGWCHL
ncbi:hypothetical protein MKW98_013806, partial [Papaver atlanticum]